MEEDIAAALRRRMPISILVESKEIGGRRHSCSLAKRNVNIHIGGIDGHWWKKTKLPPCEEECQYPYWWNQWRVVEEDIAAPSLAEKNANTHIGGIREDWWKKT